MVGCGQRLTGEFLVEGGEKNEVIPLEDERAQEVARETIISPPGNVRTTSCWCQNCEQQRSVVSQVHVRRQVGKVGMSQNHRPDRDGDDPTNVGRKCTCKK